MENIRKMIRIIGKKKFGFTFSIVFLLCENIYTFDDIDCIVSDEPAAHGPDHQEQHHRQNPLGEVGHSQYLNFFFSLCFIFLNLKKNTKYLRIRKTSM